MAATFKELRVWQTAMDSAMVIFEKSKSFPSEEKYSLTDQIRRASRSVAACISEAWRRRRYVAAFVSKLNEAETEAAEVQTWIEIALRCKYWPDELARELDDQMEKICSQLTLMIRDAQKWCTPGRKR